MIFLFKRIVGLIALLIVEFILFILFALFYTKALWTNWNSDNSLYVLIAIVIAFILTLFLLIRNKNALSLIEKEKKFVEAKLTNKKQFGKMQRQLFIWQYTYIIDGKQKKSLYWHVNAIRELNVNDTFLLAINPNNPKMNYFPFVPPENHSN